MTLNKSLVCLAIASLSIPAMAAPVTTEGTGVGKHGDVIAAVTFDGGRIQAIDIRKSNENPILAGKVFTEMKDAMIKHNTADIDAVTGATVSSDALRNAVKEAAAKAGVTLAGPVALLKRAPKVPETNVYDVVVIGAGGAGFSAAITASDAGAKVVLLEKMPNVGGNSLVSGAEMAAAGNWVQKKLGIEGDSVELHYQDTMKGGDMKGDPAVVRTMVENALPAAEWCRDVIGVEFQEDNLFFGGHSKKRSLIPKGATGLDFITKFSAAAEKRGIPIITNMKAEELVRDASGRVTGVKATMDGKRYTFSARKGVVIATGGFAANVAMRTEANPFYGDGFKTTNMPGAMGEGITMAKNIGAQVVNMGLIQTYPMCDPNSGAIELIDDARFEGAILVNQEGKRFVEELQRRDVMSKAILEQTGKYCYAIFNGEIEKRSHPHYAPSGRGRGLHQDGHPAQGRHHRGHRRLLQDSGRQPQGHDCARQRIRQDGQGSGLQLPQPLRRPQHGTVLDLPRRSERAPHDGRPEDQSEGRSARRQRQADSRPLGGGRSDGLHARHEPPRLERLHRHHRLRPHRGCGSCQMMT